ncbi:cyclic nucleotide-binding domain-containing protein [Devosia algicola]|uniref:Cyclic nucleotide-binding domain-containing protein n=1 Tax=Devosia algicola TaxID=3026418 RepID=A0ABY7YKG9_9HYPH|nr:cyclic nucleotide-binding domain-containing protein [Devosia algicola]WDR01784.1 cyclic nucleotide-binding domain-containing protein [Devosia algicola]
MRLDDAAVVLASADFFDICDDEQKRLLAFSSEQRLFAPDDVIYRAGEVPLGAHVLISGTLKIQPEGKAKPSAISAPGSVVSTIALILSKSRPISITAVVECETLFVPRASFLKLCRQSPDLAERAADRIQSDLSAYLGALEPVGAKMKR